MINRLELTAGFLYTALILQLFMLGYSIALQVKPASHTQVTEKCVDGRVLIKFGDRKALEIHPTTRELMECN